MLVMLAVIFIPMILDDSAQTNPPITGTNIPPKPAGGFTSHIVPLPGNDFARRPVTPPQAESTQPTAAGAGGDAASADADKAQAAATGTGTNSSGSPQESQAPAPAAPPTAQSAPAPAAVAPAKTSSAGTKTAGGTASERVGVTAWVVQLGSFSSADNANGLNDKLRKAGYPSYVERISQNSQQAFRVRIGPELLRSEAEALQKKIKAGMGLDSIVLQYP